MALLQDFPSKPILIGVTLLGLIVSILLRPELARAEAEMKAAGDFGIVAYELAFTDDQADRILKAWKEPGQAAALSSLLIDFAFMPAYAFLFSGLTLLLARSLPARAAAVGRWLALGQWAAAILDAVENIALLRLLGMEGAVTPTLPLIAGIAASIKFALLGAAVVYWLAGSIIWVINLPTIKGRRR